MSKIVVFDNGTAAVKCGFAGEAAPSAVIPTVVSRRASAVTGTTSIDVGEECCAPADPDSDVCLSFPISNGVVQKWDDMASLWDYAFRGKLQVAPSDCRVLLTDPPMNTARAREKLVEVMFERLGVHSLFLQLSSVLPLYAQGVLTGLVVDSGESFTYAVPVVEGYAYTHAAKRLSVAGKQITAYLRDLSLRRGYFFSQSHADTLLLRQLKEELCYVSCDYSREQQLAEETTVLVEQFRLPDGRSIRIAEERFQAPEALFSPELVDREEPGIADAVFRAVQESDIDHRLSLYQNIMLSGGSSMFPGLSTRLEREVRERYLTQVLRGNADGLKKLKLRVEDPPNHRYLGFAGGAVMADIMKEKSDFWVSRGEYEEQGARCLKKCE